MGFIATIGFFDGVHVGHRYVIRELCAEAEHRGMQAMVISFSCHPRQLLSPDMPVTLLTTTVERETMLRECGVHKVEMLRFEDVRKMTAEQFMQYIHEQFNVDALLMGYDQRFGSDMPATADDYKSMAARVGLEIVQLTECDDVNTHVSSTVIRRMLLKGKVTDANRLLGYEYSLSGKVVHGRQLGRQIGFPTANIEVEGDKLIPMDGVYAVGVCMQGKLAKGILNIGNNPTINAEKRTLEVHIVDYDGELYEQQLTVSFRRFIREERSFRSIEDLRKQIAADVSGM